MATSRCHQELVEPWSQNLMAKIWCFSSRLSSSVIHMDIWRFSLKHFICQSVRIRFIHAACSPHVLFLFITYFVFDVSLTGTQIVCISTKFESQNSACLLSLAYSWVLIWVMCMFCGRLVKSIHPILVVRCYLCICAYDYLRILGTRGTEDRPTLCVCVRVCLCV